MSSELDTGPWYKQPWAWFVLTPLIVVVIVSALFVTASVVGRDDRVIDNYYKEGRMINMRLDEDLRAIAIKAEADLDFNQQAKEITIKLTLDNAPWPKSLNLELSHPAQAEKDTEIVLTAVSSGFYQGSLPVEMLEHRWYLRILPVFEQDTLPLWRLRGEINFDQTQSINLVHNG